MRLGMKVRRRFCGEIESVLRRLICPPINTPHRIRLLSVVAEAQTPSFNPVVNEFLQFVFPAALGRKWLMVSTLPLIIVGIMRYAQLIYEKRQGEAPEKLLATDKALLAVIGLWGLSVILFIYLL